MENQDKNELLQTFINKKRNFMDEIMQGEFKTWIEKYMQEDTPKTEKILSYNVGTAGYGTTNDNSGIIKVTIDFYAETVSKDSIWKSFVQGESSYYDRNTCYIEIEVLDEENFRINYIGAEPKNLAEFQKEFKEYKKTHTETVVVPLEESKEYNAQNVVKLSNGITALSVILIVLSIGFVIYKVINKNKQKPL